MNTIPSVSPIDRVVEAYQEHLLNVAGLQPSTGQKWTFFVRLFLNAQFKPKTEAVDLRELTPQALLDFVLQQSEHYPPGQVQSLASALRSFCRFLCVSGRQDRDLSTALPPIADAHREALPRYLSEAQLEAVLGAVDRRTPVGQRDYALLLCLARLGLRAGEVARLTLEDVDWAAGCLRLTATKGRRERQLPLPAEVGQALVAYLRTARPTGPTRALFRTLRGERPLRVAWLSARVGAVMARAGVAPPGQRAHLLRHTVATHLVQQGVSLKAVADLLGHTSLSTTQVYAKVNLPMLRSVAQPWPGQAEEQP